MVVCRVDSLVRLLGWERHRRWSGGRVMEDEEERIDWMPNSQPMS